MTDEKYEIESCITKDKSHQWGNPNFTKYTFCKIKGLDAEVAVEGDTILGVRGTDSRKVAFLFNRKTKDVFKNLEL